MAKTEKGERTESEAAPAFVRREFEVPQETSKQRALRIAQDYFEAAIGTRTPGPVVLAPIELSVLAALIEGEWQRPEEREGGPEAPPWRRRRS